MAASYPSSIKSYTTKVDDVDDVLAADMNSVQEEIVAIETELGANGKQKLIKGWCQVTISGGTPTIVDHNNVTSITDNGTGDFTITWDTDFSNANYAVFGSSKRDTSGAATTGITQGVQLQCISSNPAVGSVRICTPDNSGSLIDVSMFSLAAIGDM